MNFESEKLTNHGFGLKINSFFIEFKFKSADEKAST